MTASLLHIHHWRNDYLLARDHPEPQRARAALDRLGERLPEELAGGLARWFAGDDGVVVIEHLAFDCELDLSRAPELLAARWAARFARALAQALDSGEGVLRFPSAAAYRARFVADLAAGRAWHAWYYRPFAGLQALSAAAAIRTALLEDPSLGRATLAALPDEVWPALAAVLTRREAARILDGLTREGGGSGADPQRLGRLSARAAPLLPPGAPGAVHALAILSAALRDGQAATPELAAWARLAGALSARGGDGAAGAAALPGGEDAAPAARPDGEVERLLAAHPEWRRPLAELLAPAAAGPQAAPAGSDFAGLALLLNELDEALDPALAAALPSWDGAAPRNLAAWLALACCAGAPRAARFLREAFWRDFFALPPSLGAEELHAWLGAADAAPALARLAERAQAWARGARGHALLRSAGQRLWLEVDEPTGIWCRWHTRPPRALQGTTLNAENAERAEDAEQCENDAARAPGGRSLSLRALCASAPSASKEVSSLLAAARRARQDWRYLDAGWALPAPWQRFFIQLAQLLLRRFAYRIPGFAGTSAPHLYANFLAGAGRLDAGCLRRARPPLHALLNLTGIARARLHWSGPPARSLLQEYLP